MIRKLLIGVAVATSTTIGLYIYLHASEPLPAVASAMERCVEEKVKLLPAHEKVSGAVVFLEICKENLRMK